MRIVHSFWSKCQGVSHHWPSQFDFLKSQLLSVTLARKAYGNIHLVTDTPGAELFEKAGICYDSIDISLDNCQVDPRWWSWGKILAYSRQNEPFIHIDGDVYLWKKLPIILETSPLICQSYEGDGNTYFGEIYDKPRYQLEKVLPKLPDYFKYCNERVGVNAGIMGGTDIEFYKQFANSVFGLIDGSTDLSSVSHWGVVFFEQQLSYCLARQEGKKWTPLLEHLSLDQTSYTHAMGAKSDENFVQRMRDRVVKECGLHSFGDLNKG